jgi:curved DNA-binding protein
MDYKDYYTTLGVSKSADEKEIKRAFRKLAQQYHPDKNPGDAQAEARFKEINEAYTVLSDPEKRSKYDRFGAQWEQYSRAGGRPEDFDWGNWAGGAGAPGGTYGRTVTPEEFEQMFGGAGGFSSFFDALFGGGLGGSRMGGQPRTGGTRYGFGYEPRTAPREAPADVAVEITLQEAFQGTTRLLQSDDGTRMEVNIPRGVKTGSRVRMRRGPAGDIYLRVTVAPDNRFTRDGDDLRVRVPVDLYTAVLGGETEVPTLERPVVLRIPAGTQSGKTFRLRGLGMPELKQPDRRGDLFAEVEITVPTNLSAEERRHFEELRRLRA